MLTGDRKRVRQILIGIMKFLFDFSPDRQLIRIAVSYDRGSGELHALFFETGEEEGHHVGNR